MGKAPNMKLANGKMLFDEFCLSCDNHNFNREVFDLMESYDLLRFLDPVPPPDLA